MGKISFAERQHTAFVHGLRVDQAVTAALQGLAGGNIGGALAGASAPYLAGVIKKVAGDNENVRVMAMPY